MRTFAPNWPMREHTAWVTYAGLQPDLHPANGTKSG